MEIFHIPNKFLDSDTIPDIHWFDFKHQEERTACKISLSTHLFSFVLQGEKQIANLEHQHTVSSSQFLMLRKSHCLMTERLSENQQYHSVLFTFDENILHDFIYKHQLQIRPEEPQASYQIFERDAFINNYVTSLQLLTANQNSEALKRAKFEELMLYLIKKYGTQVLAFFMTPAPEQLQFHQQMEGLVNHKLSLEELAFLCHMSLSTFKRKFQQHYGSSPSKWFLKKRLEQAAYMLRNQQMSPSEVYLETGFESLSGFTQAFKKEYHLTPKKYQHQI